MQLLGGDPVTGSLQMLCYESVQTEDEDIPVRQKVMGMNWLGENKEQWQHLMPVLHEKAGKVKLLYSVVFPSYNSTKRYDGRES